MRLCAIPFFCGVHIRFIAKIMRSALLVLPSLALALPVNQDAAAVAAQWPSFNLGSLTKGIPNSGQLMKEWNKGLKSLQGLQGSSGLQGLQGLSGLSGLSGGGLSGLSGLGSLSSLGGKTLSLAVHFCPRAKINITNPIRYGNRCIPGRIARHIARSLPISFSGQTIVIWKLASCL